MKFINRLKFFGMKSIQLAKPCSENWEQMQPHDKNRFCGLCQTHVHDMTALSIKEMEHLLRANKGQLCGRLSENQLIRYNAAQENQPFFRFARLTKVLSTLSVLAVAFFTMPLKRALAANQFVISQSQFPNRDSEEPQQCPPLDTTRIVKVTVFDTMNQPIIGATVEVLNEFKKNLGGTITDLDGHATVEIKTDYNSLRISFKGQKTIIYDLNPNSDSIVFRMEEDCALREEVIYMLGYINSAPKSAPAKQKSNLIEHVPILIKE